jgi:hypothetical protein
MESWKISTVFDLGVRDEGEHQVQHEIVEEAEEQVRGIYCGVLQI